MMRLTASGFYTFFRPSKCENRVYLSLKDFEEAPPSPYGEIIRRLGERHESDRLSLFPEAVNLRLGTLEDRENGPERKQKKRPP
jgi:hypothetical protein